VTKSPPPELAEHRFRGTAVCLIVAAIFGWLTYLAVNLMVTSAARQEFFNSLGSLGLIGLIAYLTFMALFALALAGVCLRGNPS
jgi:hypothetical protein